MASKVRCPPLACLPMLPSTVSECCCSTFAPLDWVLNLLYFSRIFLGRHPQKRSVIRVCFRDICRTPSADRYASVRYTCLVAPFLRHHVHFFLFPIF